MKQYTSMMDQGNGSKNKVEFVRFWNGSSATLDRYQRINKIRLMRRVVIGKRSGLYSGK